MKRYMVFMGEKYYPGQGMEDFKKDFDNIAEAERYLSFWIRDTDEGSGIWGHIWDCVTRMIIVKGSKG